MRRPIFLIGYMGAGKTTIGRLLANKLGWHFVDLDEAFFCLYGVTPGNYISKYSEAEFRKQERRCLETVAELEDDRLIIAAGGGLPCYEDNMDCLLEYGTVIYLKWPSAQLAERLLLTDLSERPILQGKNLQELTDFVEWQMSGRAPFYEQAHWIVPAQFEQIDSNNDKQLAEQVFELIECNKQ